MQIGHRRKTKLSLWALAALMLALIPVSVSMAAQPPPPHEGSVLVGHVSYLEGELLYYVTADNNWVAAVKDAPFGIDDAFYSGDDGKAEFILPNMTRLRVDALTQVQLIALKDDLTQVDVASGTARFFNDSDGGLVKVTTPFGYAVGESGASFDLYVGDQSAELTPLSGAVYFVNKQGRRYDVNSGSSIIASADAVTGGSGTVDSQWQAWNDKRDSAWENKIAVKGDSREYLPAGLYDEAGVLDDSGRWERVDYEGEERELWRPNVGSDWAPYTNGRWTVYHGDNAWIPEDEPFGYVTGHYGDWVYLDTPGGWYWMPPEPALGIAFSWFPGRVGWLYSDAQVGWFPLAPVEPFYAHRYWGPGTVVVGNANVFNLHMNRFRFADRAVVVPQPDLFAVANYRRVRLANMGPAVIARDFRPTPVINSHVIRNFRQLDRRFQFAPGRAVNRVPHQLVVQRIRQNQRLSARAQVQRTAVIQQNLRRMRAGRISTNAAVGPPRVRNMLVSRNQANVAARQLQFRQEVLKRQAVQVQSANQQQRARQLAQLRQIQQQAAVQQRQRSAQAIRQQQQVQRLQQQRLQQQRQAQIGVQQQRQRQAQGLQQRQRSAQAIRQQQQAQRVQQQQQQAQRVQQQRQQQAQRVQQQQQRQRSAQAIRQQQQAQRVQQQQQAQRVQQQRQQQAQRVQQQQQQAQRVQQQRQQQAQRVQQQQQRQRSAQAIRQQQQAQRVQQQQQQAQRVQQQRQAEVLKQQRQQKLQQEQAQRLRQQQSFRLQQQRQMQAQRAQQMQAQRQQQMQAQRQQQMQAQRAQQVQRQRAQAAQRAQQQVQQQQRLQQLRQQRG